MTHVREEAADMVSRGASSTLQNYLMGLEARARRATPGYRRTNVIEAANRSAQVRQLGVRLSSSTVSDWFKRGRVSANFDTLWIFVEELLKQGSSKSLRSPMRADSSWLAERAWCQGLWEAARETSIDRSLDRKGAAASTSHSDETHCENATARDRIDWLTGYLHAAASAARKHPYAGVLPDRTPPPLSEVYVRQLVKHRAMSKTSDAADMPETKLAETIVRQGDDCIVVGGPGSGKTSLLRMAVRWLAEDFDTSSEQALVPLYVPATRIVSKAKSFLHAIARAVNSDLSGCGLLDPLTEDILRQRPLIGGRWLILIDGLDEVGDSAQRQDLLAALASIQGRHDDSASTYLFIVASRPLPSREWERGQWRGLSRGYELLPFRMSQLSSFAETWLKMDGHPEPRALAQSFLTQIQRTRLADMARAPLVATMVCQLFSMNPDNSLPMSRSALYDEFIQLTRQYASTNAMPTAVHRDPNITSMQAASVVRLYRKMYELLPRLALALLDRPNKSVLGLMLDWARKLQPKDLSTHIWGAHAKEGMRRTGVLVEQGGDFRFVHQSLVEFFAAQYIASDNPARSEREFQRVFGESASDTPWRLGSFHCFLIAAWHANESFSSRLTQAIRHMATKGDLKSCLAVAEITREGIPVEDTTCDAVADKLVALSTDPDETGHSRVEAAKALGHLGNPGCGKMLVTLASDASLPSHTRVDAAKALGDLGDQRGGDLLVELATAPYLPGEFREFPEQVPRLRAAWALGDLGDPRQGDVLVALIARPGFKGSCRLAAARGLGWIGDPRHADALVDVATGPATHTASSTRIRATMELGELGDGRAIEILLNFAMNGAYGDRVHAAIGLEKLRDPRALDLLGTLAADTAAHCSHRLEAAKTLSQSGDRRGADILVELATNRALGVEFSRLGDSRRYNPHPRVQAAKELIQVEDPRAIDVISRLSSEVTLDNYYRVEAAHELWRLDQSRGTRLLAQFANDHSDLLAQQHAEQLLQQVSD